LLVDINVRTHRIFTTLFLLTAVVFMPPKTAREKTQSGSPEVPAARRRGSRRRWWIAASITLTVGVIGSQGPWWFATQSLKQRDANAALGWLNWAERCGTDKGTIAIARNRAFLQLGQFEDVRKQLLLANALGVSRERIQREEWLAFAQSGQMEIAEPHLSDLLVSQDIPVGETCAAYAAGFLLTARPGEALQLIEAWLKDEPGAHQAYYLRGQTHASVKQFAAAEEAFQQALKLAPGRNDVLLALAESLLELQRPEDAQPYFQRAAEARGFVDADRARLGWARAARRQGDSAIAEQLLTDITNRCPERAEVWEELGRAQSDRGATDSAIRSLEQAVALQPATVSARQALGTMLAAAGRADAAQPHLDYTAQALADLERLRLLEDSAEKDPRDVETRWEIAELYRRYDTPDQAMAWARSVLLLEPAHEGAMQLLATQGRILQQE
jgi:tetratricopeptide (TPR) repeat protein